MYKDKIIELCMFHIDNKDDKIAELQAENIDLINHQDFDKQGKFKEVIDELQAEAIEQIKDNKKLQAEINELLIAKDDKKRLNHELRNKLADARAKRDEFGRDRDDNKKNVDILKAENERLKKGFGHGVLVELEQVDSLKEEIESLQDQLKDAVNDYESLLNSNGVK